MKTLRTKWLVAFQVQEGEPFESFVAASPDAKGVKHPPGSTTFDVDAARDFLTEEAALDEAIRIRLATAGRSLACAAKVETRFEVLPIDSHFRRLIATGGAR